MMNPNPHIDPTKKDSLLASISKNIWYIFQAAVVAITFVMGLVTGSMGSYIAVKAEQENLRAAELVTEHRMDALEKAVTEAKLEDRAFVLEMRTELLKITDLLTDVRLQLIVKKSGK